MKSCLDIVEMVTFSEIIAGKCKYQLNACWKFAQEIVRTRGYYWEWTTNGFYFKIWFSKVKGYWTIMITP